MASDKVDVTITPCVECAPLVETLLIDLARRAGLSPDANRARTGVTAPAAAGPIDPDCRGGKHKACAGSAWDDTTDALTPCTCPCHQAVKP